MKLIGKLLGGLATAAALAALVPYTSDYDPETDTAKTRALLWTLQSKPGQEGKRVYHFALGKEDAPVMEFQSGEDADDIEASAEAKAAAADAAQAEADALQAQADAAQAQADRKAAEAEAALDAAEDAADAPTEE